MEMKLPLFFLYKEQQTRHKSIASCPHPCYLNSAPISYLHRYLHSAPSTTFTAPLLHDLIP